MPFQNCDLCGGKLDLEYRCDSCGSVWPAGKLRDVEIGKAFSDYSYNRYHGIVSEIYRHWTRICVWGFLGRNLQSRLIAWLLTLLQGGRGSINLKEPSSIIDVGCGRGAFLKELPNTWTKMGTDIVDYNETELTIAVGAFEELSFTQRFDIVRSWHSLEHSYRPVEFLERMEDLVAFDGLLIVSTPNSDSLSARLFRRHWLPYGVDTHYWIPSRRALEDWLSNRGWSIYYSRTYTYFSAAGSLAALVGVNACSFITLIPFILISFPLVVLEQLMGRGDSVVIYAKRNN